MDQYFSHIYIAMDQKRHCWNATAICMGLLAALMIKMLVYHVKVTSYLCLSIHILACYVCHSHAVPCADRDVRLVEGNVGSGRIEVCYNNSWGTICSNSWDNVDASVACKQSGYSPYGINKF